MKNVNELLEMDCLKTGKTWKTENYIKSWILVQKCDFMGILLGVLYTSILLWKVSFPFLSIVWINAALRIAQPGRCSLQGHHNSL